MQSNITSSVNAEATARANAVSAEATRAQAAEENLRQLYNSLSQSQPIPVTALPATGEAGKIYRLAGTTSYADYMYAEGALTTPIKMAEYDNAIDDEPTAGSENLVKSGGVNNTLYNRYFEPVDHDSTQDGFLGIGGNIYDYGGYVVKLYNVRPGEKFHLKCNDTLTAPNIAYYNIYSSNEPSASSLLVAGDPLDGAFEKDITIPSGGVLLAVSWRMAWEYYTIATKEKEILKVEERVQNSLFLSVKDGDIKINQKYNSTKDFQYWMKICGPNNIMALYQYGYMDNLSDMVSRGNPNTYIPTNTDWIGPYVMYAVHNHNEHSGFTGGWHDYNNNPTGRTSEYKVYADGKEITGSTALYCNEVRLDVLNYIQAGNTTEPDGSGREVLTEQVTYIFKDGRMYVSNIITALEDIEIALYYGMQVNGFWNKLKFFASDITEYPWNSSSSEVTNQIKTNDIISQMVCYDGNGHQVIAHLYNVGLGEFKSNNAGYKAFASGLKAYYYLIGTSYKQVAEGKQLYWKGWYEFTDKDTLL